MATEEEITNVLNFHREQTELHRKAIAEQFDEVPMPNKPRAAAPAPAPGAANSVAEGFPTEQAARPVLKAGKKMVPTIDNFRRVMAHEGIVPRYNLCSKQLEVVVPGIALGVDNALNVALSYITSACHRANFPVGPIEGYTAVLADENSYHPIVAWVESTVWDRRSRWEAFCDTLQVEGDTALRNTLLRRWMLSALAAAFEPRGVSAHGVLVLQGPQGIGKTHWFKNLAAAVEGATKDGYLLDPRNRDSVFQCLSHWLVELGELDATFRKADISQLKAFLTQQVDTLRRPYAKAESTFARRTVFAATVNPEDYLHDNTGNRRFWTIACTGIDHRHGIDMPQLWRELYETGYRAGEAWILSEAELKLLNESNARFEAANPIAELTAERFDWDTSKLSWTWMSATQTACLVTGEDTPKPATVSHVSREVAQRNGGMRRRCQGKNQILVPPIKLKTEVDPFS